MRTIKPILPILLIFVSLINLMAMQEFNIYDNGLIYNKKTMADLEVIVDSLNLKFKYCDLNKDYYSFDQGFAHVVQVSSKRQLKLIKEAISFEAFKKEFGRQVISEDTWVYKFIDFSDNKIEYSGLPYGWSGQENIIVDRNNKNDKNEGWVLDNSSSKAFYLKGLKKFIIPSKYARLIQYVDCMIDTTTLIYLNENRFGVFQELDKNSNALKFMELSRSFPDQPQYPDYDLDNYDSLASVYSVDYNRWDSIRMVDLDKKMENSDFHMRLLVTVRDELIAGEQSNDELEFYIGRYLSKEDELTLKRNRRVMGSCSMDLSPRYHAMSISTLAAETAKWNVFVRAHLDVMNDKFERVSDGSYAWEGRKTYLAELEELGIEAVDLLIGTSLRASNTNKNHYRGYINRIGRALSDAYDKDKVDRMLLEMISSEDLDPYNRLLMAYVFSNYNQNLNDASRKTRNQDDLKYMVANMPLYLREVWDKE